VNAAVTGDPVEVAPAKTARRAWVEQIMGMPISIHLRGEHLGDRATTAVSAAFAGLRRIDEVFSTWTLDSQVSRLRRGELTLAEADPMVRDVVRLCDAAREATDGWFEANLPDGGGGRAFDPTGLVKGWAVQRACSALACRLPEHDVLITAGGDVAVSSGRRDTPPWRLGIEDPRDRSRLLGTVELRTGGLATSGTAARGAHIVSPRTGRAATALASVSVAGPSLMWADVYATAAFARGTEGVDWLRTRSDHTWLVVALDGTVTRS
jgi:thiamine biosynthesis lipoprotein